MLERSINLMLIPVVFGTVEAVRVAFRIVSSAAMAFAFRVASLVGGVLESSEYVFAVGVSGLVGCESCQNVAFVFFG